MRIRHHRGVPDAVDRIQRFPHPDGVQAAPFPLREHPRVDLHMQMPVRIPRPRRVMPHHRSLELRRPGPAPGRRAARPGSWRAPPASPGSARRRGPAPPHTRRRCPGAVPRPATTTSGRSPRLRRNAPPPRRSAAGPSPPPVSGSTPAPTPRRPSPDSPPTSRTPLGRRHPVAVGEAGALGQVIVIRPAPGRPPNRPGQPHPNPDTPSPHRAIPNTNHKQQTMGHT